MRFFIFLLHFILLFSIGVNATLIDTVPFRKSTVHYSTGKSEKGFIVGVNDSTVSFVSRGNRFAPDPGIQNIPAEQISVIERLGKKKPGFWECVGGGGILGLIIGVALYSGRSDDNEEDGFFDNLPDSAIVTGVLTLVGLGIGFIASFFVNKRQKSKFIINGSRNNLKAARTDILLY